MNPLIRDMEGNLIEVTDLKEAILQTAGHLSILYQQQEPALQAFAKIRQRYWKGIFQKLGALKSSIVPENQLKFIPAESRPKHEHL